MADKKDPAEHAFVKAVNDLLDRQKREREEEKKKQQDLINFAMKYGVQAPAQGGTISTNASQVYVSPHTNASGNQINPKWYAAGTMTNPYLPSSKHTPPTAKARRFLTIEVEAEDNANAVEVLTEAIRALAQAVLGAIDQEVDLLQAMWVDKGTFTEITPAGTLRITVTTEGLVE